MDVVVNELNDRFPSGPWCGFYVQPDSRRRFAMDLVLTFAADRVSGMGRDTIGEFTIHGVYDTLSGQCSWTKAYIGQHSVEYAGRACHGGIVGQWSMRGEPSHWTGPFFIWPRAAGDLSAAFERAFLETELTALADAPAELVEA